MKAYVWRENYKRGKLDWQTVRRLNKMNFPWDGQSFNWFNRYFEAYGFLKAYVRWPSTGNETAKPENELAEWLSIQRRMYGLGILSPKKKWLLDRLNFDWGGYLRKQSLYKTNG